MVHMDLAVMVVLRAYSNGRGLSLTYASRLLAGSGDTILRLESGGSLTGRRAAAIIQTASNRWPPDLEWPADIPRPDPLPDSPAAQALASPPPPEGNPVALVEAARERRSAAMEASDWAAAERANLEALTAGTRLGPDGRIASPAALCKALGVERQLYHDVLRHYRDGRGTGRRPRKGTVTERMFDALVLSGDVRFASRRPRAAA